MKLIRIIMVVTVLIASVAGAGQAEAGTANKRELARKILSNSDFPDVLGRARKLVGSGLRAGSGYGEVWIRDLNTFIELALDTQDQDDLKQALLVFFHFQGEDGNIVDGYIPKDFDEAGIYYHDGTTIAMEAGLLTTGQLKRVCRDMINNKRSAGAGTIGLTVFPAYPKGFFANRSMVPWSYQNGGDWTWFGGRTIQQLIRHGLIEEAYQEMLPMVERVGKNNGFYEWYTVDNKPRGSGKFRGSAGVLGKAIIMIRQWAEEHKD